MSDELRDLVRGSAERVSVPPDDVGDVVRAGRSLKWRRRLYTGGAIVLVTTLVWVGIPALTSSGNEEAPRIAGSPTPTASETDLEPAPFGGRCQEVPFRATRLPEGWSYELRPGLGLHRGMDDIPPEERTPPGGLGHYGIVGDDKSTTHVNIILYGNYYTLPDGVGEPIEVMGQEGRIGSVEDGFTAEFLYGDCEYSVMAFGISKGELRAIAESLRPTDTCTHPRLAGPDIPLEDGKYFGYIEGMTERSIQFDEADFLTGEDATEAAVASGAIEEGDVVPNDYFIQNEDKSSGAVGFSKDVRILVETTWMDGSVGPAPADPIWLACAFQSKDPVDAAHLRSPWWITVEDYEVVKMEEQYLP